MEAERDRAFDREDLTELLGRGKKAMEKAEELSSWFHGNLRTVREQASRLPEGIDGSEVRQLASDLIDTIRNEGYLETAELFQKKIPALIGSVFPDDRAGAEKLRSAADRMRNISFYVSSLEDMIGRETEAGGIEEMTRILEKLQSDFQEGISASLEEMREKLASLNGENRGVCESSADPVNLSTGNLYYEKEDLSIGGQYPLYFQRTYNAADVREGVLGTGWSHNYELSIREERGCLRMRMEEGKEEVWEKSGEEYFPRYGRRGKLRRLPCGDGEGEHKYIYSTPEGLEYVFLPEEGKKERRSWWISEIREQGKVSLSFSYREGRLHRVSTENGSFFEYRYQNRGKAGSGNPRLSALFDQAGRAVRFFYRDDRLSQVEDVLGKRFRYHYDEAGRMDAVTNRSGIVTVRNHFDEKGRTTRQDFPDGGRMRYRYSEEKREVVLTEQNGNERTYLHDENFLTTEIRDRDGTERYEYNRFRQRTLVTDRKGRRTRFRYDDHGNITQIVNAKREKLNFTYDSGNRLLAFSLNGRRRQTNVYDMRGRLIRSIDALGRSREIAYDGEDRPIRIREMDGSETELSYDERGNLTEIRDAFGGRRRFRYDGLNRRIESEDGNGNRTKYRYDAAGQLSTVTNAAGDSRYFRYTENGQLCALIDFDGTKSELKYNSVNQLSKWIDPNGEETDYHYDQMWRLREETRPNGGKIRYHYDLSGRLTRLTLPDGAELSYAYDATGMRIEERGAYGERIRYEYDALDRETAMIDPLGRRTEKRYDADGNLESIVDSEGRGSHYTYDAAGQLLSETDALGRRTCYSYTALGQIASVTDSEGNKTVYTYERGGRLKEILYPDGQLERFCYDKEGNLSSLSDGKGEILRYHYDCLNRITEITAPDGEKKTFCYDALGRVTKQIDAEGQETSYGYTKSGRLASVRDALGGLTEYRYDAMDQLVEIRQKGRADGAAQSVVEELPGIDPELLRARKRNRESRVTRYLRNLSGQVEEIENALGEKESFRYDGYGRLLEKIDAEGHRIAFSYGRDGNLSAVRAKREGDTGRGELEARFLYDAHGNLMRAEDWSGTLHADYDDAGRVRRIVNAEGDTLSYYYDEKERKRSISYPDGTEAVYRYDSLGRLVSLSSGTEKIEYHYGKEGRLSEKRYGDGMRSNYRYDRLGRLTELLHIRGEERIESYRFRYDRLGNRSEEERYRRGAEEENGIYSYRYDALGRLCCVEKDGVCLRNYRYDSFGNRTEKTEQIAGRERRTAYQYNALDQLISEREEDGGATDYFYDHRGKLTEIRRQGRIQKRYRYDRFGRMSGAEDADGSSISYCYNSLGQRIRGEEKLPSGQRRSSSYLIDGTRVWHNLLAKTERICGGGEMEGNPALLHCQNYIYDEEEEAAILLDRGERKEGLYYLSDALGSVERLTDQTGRDRALYRRDEFGMACGQSEREWGRSEGKEGISQPFGFTGYLWDEVAGTYYAQARQYRPETGRFDGMDLVRGFLSAPFSLNRYTYCWGNPLELVDPDGAFPKLPSLRKLGKGISQGLSKVGKWVGDHKVEIITGVAIMVTAVFAAPLGLAATVAICAGAGFAVGSTATVVDDWISGRKISAKKALINGLTGAAAGVFAGIGAGVCTFLANTAPVSGMAQGLIGSTNAVKLGMGIGGGLSFIGSTVSEIISYLRGDGWHPTNIIVDTMSGMFLGAASGSSMGISTLIKYGVILGEADYVLRTSWNKGWEKKGVEGHVLGMLEAGIIGAIAARIAGSVANISQLAALSQLESRQAFEGLTRAESMEMLEKFPVLCSLELGRLIKELGENAVKLGVPATIASTTLNISEAISKGLKALLDKLRSEWKKACPITR